MPRPLAAPTVRAMVVLLLLAPAAMLVLVLALERLERQLPTEAPSSEVGPVPPWRA
jgi:hypothetical protein